MVLLGCSECNRPTFFSLTTGACELPSLPFPGRGTVKAQPTPLLLFFFPLFTVPSCSAVCVGVSSCPRLCLFHVWPFHSLLFPLVVSNTWWHPPPPKHTHTIHPSKRQGKHLGDVQSRLAVENLGADSTVLIENLEALEAQQKSTNKCGFEQMQCDMQP